jgi:Xaa-Pro aminopeptidase
MRILKDSEEIEILRRAGEISSLAHTRAMIACQPGMFEYHLEGEIHHEFSRHGSRFSSYNTIVGSGRNTCILHYNENREKLSDGDLVLIDAGCELDGYAIDITRTFPISGRFSMPQQAIYTIVLDAFNKAISLFRPGTSISEVNEEVILIIVKGLVGLNILRGNINTLVTEKAYRQFYMHSLGHYIGLDIHDVARHNMRYDQIVLEAGMVLSVEPGLYITPESSAPKEYHNTGIRIEDSILITEKGNENLTNGVVKDICDIESLMENSQSL